MAWAIPPVAITGAVITASWGNNVRDSLIDIELHTHTGVAGQGSADITPSTINTTGGGALLGTWSDLGTVTTIDINGGTIDGAVIGGSVKAAGSFTTLIITSFGAGWTNAGRTVADLGIVTTVDINGGTIDGAVIGGSSAANGTFTTLTVNTAFAGSAFKDEDNMASDSATAAASQQSIKKYVDDNAAPALTAQIATGTYTGDGSEGQAITGVGFQPKFLWLAERITADGTGNATRHIFTWPEILADGAGGVGGGWEATSFRDNRIVSLDADGFTVDDNGSDSNPNKSGITYNYLAIG